MGLGRDGWDQQGTWHPPKRAETTHVLAGNSGKQEEDEDGFGYHGIVACGNDGQPTASHPWSLDASHIPPQNTHPQPAGKWGCPIEIQLDAPYKSNWMLHTNPAGV